MARNKLTIDFRGIDEYQKKLEAIGGDATKRAFESAMKASQQVVKQSVTAAMQPHRETGETAGTVISDKPVEWTQSTAKIPVGFDIGEDKHWKDDRLSSVFVMYGTNVHGQPHVAPDRKLYDAVYGAAVRRKIRKLQEDAFKKVLRRLGG